MGKKAKAVQALGAQPSEAQRAWAARHADRARQERGFRKSRAELLDRWSHKNEGTPETHEAFARRCEGAIARLHQSGYLNDDELAWAHEIREVADNIMAAATVKTASLETRVDTSRYGDVFFESLGSVWGEIAYSTWRARLGCATGLVLDIIVRDMALTTAASLHAMHVRKAKRLLTTALQLWPRFHATARRTVDAEDLQAAHADLLR